MPKSKKDLIEFENWAFGRRSISVESDRLAWNNLHGDLNIFKKNAFNPLYIMNSLYQIEKDKKGCLNDKQ